MPETKATILIPDISGFTEFMTTTELSHSSIAINGLIESIVNTVGEEYEVSEIEGDAVLLIKKGPAPSKKEILDICLKIFNAFHSQQKWMQEHTICPCHACRTIRNLSLKFVAHHGPVSEIKVGRFAKLSGPEMIVAHRLLKNSIGNNEYVLMSDKLLQHTADSSQMHGMQWANSSEEYSSIGKVDYSFTLLNEIRKNFPQPTEHQSYRTDNTPYLTIPIAANFRDVYMAVMNIPGRPEWVPGLQKVEQDMPHVFIGSIHRCTFEDFQAIVSPLKMTLSNDEILYAESCRMEEKSLSLIYEYIFKKVDEDSCEVSLRFMNANQSSIPEEVKAALSEKMQQMAERLKEYCKGRPSHF
jgi:hypothetical protein